LIEGLESLVGLQLRLPIRASAYCEFVAGRRIRTTFERSRPLNTRYSEVSSSRDGHAPKETACRSGLVAIVVITAISISIANNVGDRMCISRPMLSTINSIKPRVFIKIPNIAASFQSEPVNRAATKPPPNLPNDATPMISRPKTQFLTRCTRPISVRQAVNAKNTGNKSNTIEFWSFSRTSEANTEFCGIATPARNAPNSA
jgi:hypothetical protein